MMKHARIIVALVLFCVAIPIHAYAGNITLSAAASLTNAMGGVLVAFEKKYPHIKVHTNFAASNPLLQQIREGAPVDVFASADQATMDKAQAENLIDPATRYDFAGNELVLIVPVCAPEKHEENQVALLKSAHRIAVGNPHSVPAGRYGRDALQSMGLWDSLGKAMVFGENVRQVLDYVGRGEVDAGIVYATDAAIAQNKVRVIAVLSGHDPVLYPVAVIRDSANKKDAQAFVDFLRSTEGRTLLKNFGFNIME